MKAKPEVFIFSAPSGSGKTTIIKELMRQFPNLELAVSATTRKPRNGEILGKDYYFLSSEEFKQKIKENAFVEWEEVYSNQFYGTLKSEIERIRQKGNYPCFDVDVKGGIKLKEIFGNKAISFFIKPPSLKVLEERLRNRKTETEEQIRKRLDKASWEMQFEEKYDYVILNDKLEEAVKKIAEIIKSEI